MLHLALNIPAEGIARPRDFPESFARPEADLYRLRDGLQSGAKLFGSCADLP